RRCGRAAIAAVARSASTRDGRDDASAQCDFADAVIVVVCDIKIAHVVERQSLRFVELRRYGWPVIAAEARRASSGNRGQDAGARIQSAHAMLGGLGNIDVASSIYDDADRPIEN